MLYSHFKNLTKPQPKYRRSVLVAVTTVYIIALTTLVVLKMLKSPNDMNVSYTSIFPLIFLIIYGSKLEKELKRRN
jgi:predicted neutral ceramidase superfamily lipid hydrolase